MTALHSAIGDTGVQIVEERFESFTDFRGRRWKRLKKPYKIGTVRRNVRSPLKFRDLYKSFTFDADKKEVRVGSPKDYGKYHSDFPTNNGRPRRKIPLREFLGFNPRRDRDRLLDTVEDFLDSETTKGA